MLAELRKKFWSIFLAVEVLSVNFCFTWLASAPSGKGEDDVKATRLMQWNATQIQCLQNLKTAPKTKIYHH
jgi:hypothetical protein